jgi:hypothetical protein
LAGTFEGMPEKRFRARRRYAHTRVWAITALILTLGGLALHTVTRQGVFPQVAVGIGLAGLVMGIWQDRRERIYYGVEDGQLLLRRKGTVERISLDAVQDASLVDRRAARDLLLERKRRMEEQGLISAEREEFQRQFTKWCSADIGLGSFGFGHDLLDRRPDGKYDLVLLRLQDGRSLLLSPVYNQDLISALNKGKGHEQRRQHRA